MGPVVTMTTNQVTLTLAVFRKTVAACVKVAPLLSWMTITTSDLVVSIATHSGTSSSVVQVAATVTSLAAATPLVQETVMQAATLPREMATVVPQATVKVTTLTTRTAVPAAPMR